MKASRLRQSIPLCRVVLTAVAVSPGLFAKQGSQHKRFNQETLVVDPSQVILESGQQGLRPLAAGGRVVQNQDSREAHWRRKEAIHWPKRFRVILACPLECVCHSSLPHCKFRSKRLRESDQERIMCSGTQGRAVIPAGLQCLLRVPERFLRQCTDNEAVCVPLRAGDRFLVREDSGVRPLIADSLFCS